MDAPSTFGEWLRQRRSELHLTREQFATRVGCSVSALRKIEDGERRPSGQIAELMANGLVDVFACHDAHELSVIDDRHSPVPPLGHEVTGGAHRRGRR